MITEDYVSFETAKLLKEKGFDEKCMSYYGHGEFQLGHPKYMKSNTDRDGVACNGVPYDAYNDPTLQMAMKWLREEHNLFVFPFPQMNTNKFWVEIFQLSDSQEWVNLYCESIELQDYQTQEEACEAGIKYCLENLI